MSGAEVKLALAIIVAIAIGACTRIVVLSGPPDAVTTFPDSAIPDAAHSPDADDGGPLPDANLGDAALD